MCVSLCRRLLLALLTGHWLPPAVLASWGLRITGILGIEAVHGVIKTSGFQCRGHVVERLGARKAELEPGALSGSTVIFFV